eukprot:s595_g5.t1
MTGGNAWRYERSSSEKSWERLDLVTQKSEDKRACAFKPTDAQLKPGAGVLTSTESYMTRFWRLISCTYFWYGTVDYGLVQDCSNCHDWGLAKALFQSVLDVSRCHVVFKDEKHDDEDFFQLLRHYHRQGAVLCCGGVKEAGQKQGLVPKHAFSLLQVRAVPLNWHSNEYFRMVPWQLCVSRTCVRDFAIWGLHFASFALKVH